MMMMMSEQPKIMVRLRPQKAGEPLAEGDTHVMVPAGYVLAAAKSFQAEAIRRALQSNDSLSLGAWKL
jgi:hypothetical protein